MVNLSISGIFEGVEGGKVSGEIDINRTTGIPNTTKMELEMNVGGQDMKIDVNMSMTKI